MARSWGAGRHDNGGRERRGKGKRQTAKGKRQKSRRGALFGDTSAERRGKGKRQTAKGKRQKSRKEALLEDTSAGASFIMLRAGCWRERLSNSRDVADPTGDLSGRLAEEVNRRPLFCRAGHRRGSNGSDPVF